MPQLSQWALSLLVKCGSLLKAQGWGRVLFDNGQRVNISFGAGISF